MVMAHSPPPTLVVPPSGPVTAHCLRLRPGERLMPSLKQAASIVLGRMPREQCGSAFVITAVGSLRDVTLRLANASRRRTDDGDDDGGGCAEQEDGGSSNNDIKRYADRRFEIVSLTGTFSRDDGCHVHISLADAEGNVVGGHLIDGVIFTTCELVLGTADRVEFVREMDDETGYGELGVRQLLHAATDENKFTWGMVSKASLAFAIIGIVAVKIRSR